ncbi:MULTISPECIES: hypothetical protein [Pseudomonas]|uniref:hypothetical protein n=1 Tax=Pseudomonas TaxID=286 RepID=UPI002117C539|nr:MULTISPECIES: hypothetical protein [Pseudomonas]
MNTNLPKLKELAQAAQQNQYDPVALNDYGMAVPPATVLELIAEIERHRSVEAEGCKPEISNRPVTDHTADGLAMHGLDEAEGCKPDLINSPFFYALAGPDGKPHYDDFCVADNPADLECHEEGITIVPLYRHPAPSTQTADLTDVLPTAAVEGNQLVIRITTECLLHAVTCSSQWPVDETGEPIRISNGPLLIQEIIHELQREDEQGTNAMHRLLDEAALDALNNGSEAVDYDEVRP